MRLLFFVGCFAILFAATEASFAQVVWEKANASQQFLEIRNGRSGELYGLNDRLYTSADEGINWQSLNDQGHEQCFAIDSSGNLFAATASKLYISKDNGNSWSDLGFRGCSALECQSGALYAASDSGLYLSTDIGLNWAHLYSTTLKISKIAFAMSGQIFLVQNGALTRLQPDGKNAKVVFPTSYLISSIFTAPPAKVFLTVAKDIGGDLEFSTDNGESQFLEIGYGNTVLNGVVVGDSDKLYAVGGVEDISSSVVARGFAMETPETFASTTDISKGLPAADVRVLSISPKGRLLASTDSGIYRSVKSVNSVNAVTTAAPGVAFYPNPYRSLATIEITSSSKTEAQVLIYDMLGRLVDECFSGTLPAGTHAISLTRLPKHAGTYFCRVRLGTESSTLRITQVQ